MDPEICDSNFESLIIEHRLQIKFMNTPCVIAPR